MKRCACACLSRFLRQKKWAREQGSGLATVYGVVQQSRGAITVDSQVGKGSTFRVYLPARKAPVPAGEPASPDPLGGSQETILVVEDQVDVRKLIVQILQAHGYRVLEAANGYQALDEAARHPEVLHLMITDVVMPGMPGPELARRLASVHPGTRVLFDLLATPKPETPWRVPCRSSRSPSRQPACWERCAKFWPAKFRNRIRTDQP